MKHLLIPSGNGGDFVFRNSFSFPIVIYDTNNILPMSDTTLTRGTQHNTRDTTMARATKIAAMKSELISRGQAFSGSNPDSIAEDWAGRFSVIAAASWMDAGFWDADAAECCRDAGYSPDKIKAIAEDQADRGIGYSSGDLIYALCNCDASMDDLTA